MKNEKSMFWFFQFSEKNVKTKNKKSKIPENRKLEKLISRKN